MANKRMFSKAIIQSTKFLKMPASTQLLYFHLSMEADDEGIVEAFKIMQIVRCSEDDLKILVAKSFIYVLNEDLLVFIIDWENHNTIRQDRKSISIYHDELQKYINKSIICHNDNQMTTKCLTNDNQVPDKCQHSIVEYSRVEYRNVREVSSLLSAKKVKVQTEEQVQELINHWEYIFDKKVSKSIIKQVKSNIIKVLTDFTVEDCKQVINHILTDEWHLANGFTGLTTIFRPTLFAKKLETAMLRQPIITNAEVVETHEQKTARHDELLKKYPNLQANTRVDEEMYKNNLDFLNNCALTEI